MKDSAMLMNMPPFALRWTWLTIRGMLLMVFGLLISCDTQDDGMQPPSISAIPNQFVYMNTSMGPLSFVVDDPGGNVESLQITAVSGNQDLVPDQRIELTGTGRDRSIIITPAEDQTGKAQITVTVSNGQLSSEEKFTLTVDLPRSIWKKIETGLTNDLHAVYFHDSSTGWLAGTDGLVWYTRDSGLTWERGNTPTDDPISDIVFIDNLAGFAVGPFGEGEAAEGQILRTLDGGETWEQILVTESPLNDCYFHNFIFGYAVGNDGQVFITVDGGSNWLDSRVPDGIDLHAVHFIDPEVGYVAGDEGRLYISLNTGAEWTQQAQIKSISLKSLYFFDRYNGWATGASNTLAKSTNEGITWFDYDPSNGFITDTWRQVYFIDEDRGWLIGEEGRIFRSEDGGNGWTFEFIDTKNTLLDIHMINGQLGWIVGEEGTLLKYELE